MAVEESCSVEGGTAKEMFRAYYIKRYKWKKRKGWKSREKEGKGEKRREERRCRLST